MTTTHKKKIVNMKQYKEHLEKILSEGTPKAPSRPGLPGSISLFGYQWKHNLADGFPLLTTKKVYWKGVITELLWFLRGDTNVKWLNDNGVTFWNEDAYAYFVKLHKRAYGHEPGIPFNEFVKIIQTRQDLSGPFNSEHTSQEIRSYKWGDCGYQYGKVWRKWEGENIEMGNHFDNPKNCVKRALELLRENGYSDNSQTSVELRDALESLDEEVKLVEGRKIIDQITNIVKGLLQTPESRRHILTSIDPAHDNDLALYWCHALAQWNCRPLTVREREKLFLSEEEWNNLGEERKTSDEQLHKILDNNDIPKYYLDCQMYQRSADMFLGVPLNIASYALLTHIFAKICNMIPGDMIYTYGDVHIYENHEEAVNTQLQREPLELPTLEFSSDFETLLTQWKEGDVYYLSKIFHAMKYDMFKLNNYNPHPKIEAKLSTGLK